jgi:hypothetical protein
MIHGAKKPIPKLRKAHQPPLSRPGATPDSDRAKKPPLGETRATNHELEPGDRVEGLGAKPSFDWVAISLLVRAYRLRARRNV